MKVYLVYKEDNWLEADHEIQYFENECIFLEVEHAEKYAKDKNINNGNKRCEVTGELVFRVMEYEVQ